MHEKIWYSLVAASHALRPVSEMYLTCYYAWDACTSRGNNTWDTCMSRGMTREAPVSDALVLRLTRWLCISRVNPAPHACPGCISRVKNLDQLIYCLVSKFFFIVWFPNSVCRKQARLDSCGQSKPDTWAEGVMMMKKYWWFTVNMRISVGTVLKATNEINTGHR